MKPFLILCVVLLAGACVPSTRAQPSTDSVLSAEQLAQLVQSFVDRDEIVGAELLVMHRGEPVLHRAFGFNDREARRNMTTNTGFAVRSMTKPFTGMAAQMLIDEGKLDLDAPVANYLPSFDNEKSRGITVRHLLTHRGGLPVGFLANPTKPLSGYSGLSELAGLSGGHGPDFAPGTRFLYSDAGSDVLGALVSHVSGRSLEEFIRRRILDPLDLRDTFPEQEAVSVERRDRVATRYAGLAGGWTRYWGPADPVLYSFLKGSGGLFSTPRDYARFLQFWMTRQTDNAQLPLSHAAFERALAPASRDTMNNGFPGATTDYGQMWMLFRPQSDEDAVFGFGHGGSDGTHAYAFPARELVVCYFTQSRGHATRTTFEAALSHLFLAPDAEKFGQLLHPPAAGNLSEFTGLYAREGRVESLAAIIELDGALAFESPGRFVMRLRATGDRDRWTPERASNDAVTFQRENGRVTGLALTRNGGTITARRFRPSNDLPTVDELMELRGRATASDRLASLLPLRFSANVETRVATNSLVSVFATKDRSLTTIDMGDAGLTRVRITGTNVWLLKPGAEGAAVELTGLERAAQLDGSPAIAWGDWRRYYREITVLSRETFEGHDVCRVRLVPPEGFAITKLVSVATGAVLAEQGIVLIPGAGLQGLTTRYDDFRDLEGLLLPFSQRVSFHNAPGGAGAFTIRTTGATVRAPVGSAELEFLDPHP